MTESTTVPTPTPPPPPASAPTPAPDESLRDATVVHPWHFRLLVFAVTRLGAALVWCWMKTLRVTVINGEQELALRQKQTLSYAIWHRGMLIALWFWRFRRGWLLASASKDGEWAAGMMRAYGNIAIRGSSSRGGRAAIVQMVDHLRRGIPGGLISDAPRGPARVSKPGALVVAQRAGVPVIPTAFAARRAFRVKSWDRTIIPRPFSRLYVKYGDPFWVDPSLEGEAFEKRLVEFDAVMNQLADDVDALAGEPLEKWPDRKAALAALDHSRRHA